MWPLRWIETFRRNTGFYLQCQSVCVNDGVKLYWKAMLQAMCSSCLQPYERETMYAQLLEQGINENQKRTIYWCILVFENAFTTIRVIWNETWRKFNEAKYRIRKCGMTLNFVGSVETLRLETWSKRIGAQHRFILDPYLFNIYTDYIYSSKVK